MQHLFDKENDRDASTIARLQLECLRDGNYLKPCVWAENVQNPMKHFAVSVGVRDYIRPLFLYAKLCGLRNRSYAISLHDVEAFQCVNRHSDEYRNNENSKDLESQYKCSENETKDPCASCKIFFNTFEKQEKTQFNYFGNCAEFDLLQTRDSDERLRQIKMTRHWNNFKIECQNHISVFNTLKERVRSHQRIPRNHMEKYYNDTRDANLKALKYKWFPAGYELVTKNYKPTKTT